LDHADVMLGHGGLGSVLGAIETATPIVIVPLGADQLVNANIAQQLGIATIIDPAAAGPEELCEAISEVLASAAHRCACAGRELAFVGGVRWDCQRFIETAH